MNTELTVLNCLKKEMSGYDIKKFLKGINIDVEYGSIYHRINSAVKSNFAKKIKTKKGNGKPDRHIYKITDAGLKYLKKESKKYFNNNFVHFGTDFCLTLLDNKNLPEDFIEERVQFVSEKIAELETLSKKSLVQEYILIHLKLDCIYTS